MASDLLSNGPRPPTFRGPPIDYLVIFKLKCTKTVFGPRRGSLRRSTRSPNQQERETPPHFLPSRGGPISAAGPWPQRMLRQLCKWHPVA